MRFYEAQKKILSQSLLPSKVLSFLCKLLWSRLGISPDAEKIIGSGLPPFFLKFFGRSFSWKITLSVPVAINLTSKMCKSEHLFMAVSAMSITVFNVKSLFDRRSSSPRFFEQSITGWTSQITEYFGVAGRMLSMPDNSWQTSLIWPTGVLSIASDTLR